MARTTHLDPICVKLPHDLYVAVHVRADAEGLKVSEFVRAAIHQVIYGETPSVEEGYLKAKDLAARLAHMVIAGAVKQLPDSYAEAITLLESLNR